MSYAVFIELIREAEFRDMVSRLRAQLRKHPTRCDCDYCLNGRI